MPLISLIVPVYHAEATLGRAIESFLRSSGDYEMLLVLDGDQPECFQIAQGYAAKHPAIRVVYPHKRMGAFGARMEGIALAQGEYCCFLDADDRLVDGALNRYEALCDGGNIDIVNASFYISTPKKDKKNAFVAKAKAMGREEALAALFQDSYVRGFLWCKMIRRNLLLGAFATVGQDALFEDTCMSAYAFVRAERFLYVPECLYRYTKAEGPTAVSKPRTNRASYHLAAFASVRQFLSYYEPSLLPVFFKSKSRSGWSLWYDRLQDRKHGLPGNELKRRKAEAKAIFDPKASLDVAGTSYESMMDPRLNNVPKSWE